MSRESEIILEAYLLANNINIITQEEFCDVKLAIRELLDEHRNLKSAEELFNELGFIRQKDNSFGIIRYVKEINSIVPREFWHIDFYKPECVYKAYKTDSSGNREYNLGIFFEWQEAIAQQCKEFGWKDSECVK